MDAHSASSPSPCVEVSLLDAFDFCFKNEIDSFSMDNFRRGLHSYLGAGAKTSLGVGLSKLKLYTCLIQLVHFGAGNKKAM
jgi:hypothetical protein